MRQLREQIDVHIKKTNRCVNYANTYIDASTTQKNTQLRTLCKKYIDAYTTQQNICVNYANIQMRTLRKHINAYTTQTNICVRCANKYIDAYITQANTQMRQLRKQIHRCVHYTLRKQIHRCVHYANKQMRQLRKQIYMFTAQTNNASTNYENKQMLSTIANNQMRQLRSMHLCSKQKRVMSQCAN